MSTASNGIAVHPGETFETLSYSGHGSRAPCRLSAKTRRPRGGTGLTRPASVPASWRAPGKTSANSGRVG